IGWAIASPALGEELWRGDEDAVIAASGPSMALAEIVLKPDKRKMLLERQRNLSCAGHTFLGKRIAGPEGRFSGSKAVATSIAFVRYHFDIPSAALADRIRTKTSVLVAPGDYLGTERHLRIAVGYEPAKLSTALGRIGAVAAELAQESTVAGR